jgi:predicted RNA-binding Zn-ribbon protein involved in translation (DUF1610 family)
MHGKLPPFIALYFVVWVIMAISTGVIYWIRRDPAFRIKWYARISLVGSATILFFMFLVCPTVLTFLFISIFGGLIVYLSIAKTRICKSCGKIIRPLHLIHGAKFCPHCGGETESSRVFKSKPISQ